MMMSNYTAKSTRYFNQLADKIALHPVWGYILFFAILYIVFYLTFSLGAYPVGWVENGVQLIESFCESYLPQGPVKDLIINGAIAGVGGVIVFLPNILILFFLISLLEHSGYMDRAALLMDKVMHKFGLSGYSFVPLIMGFGCNVPAILATKGIKDYHSRIITILINPLMSCSARLPVYILLAGTFIPKYAPLAIFGIYLLGIILAFGLSTLIRKFIITERDIDLDLQLKPYTLPHWRTMLDDMSSKTIQYLRKMGGVILLASIAIWFLEYFPRNPQQEADHKKAIEQVESAYTQKALQPQADTLLLKLEKEQVVAQLSAQYESERDEQSYIGTIGKFIEPILRPLGFDWRVSTALLTGVAGKELIVSTMGVLYANSDPNKSTTLGSNMEHYYRNNKHKSPIAMSLALMSFVLIYSPCIPTLAAIKHETGRTKWIVFSIVYTTILAWSVSAIVYYATNLLIAT